MNDLVRQVQEESPFVDDDRDTDDESKSKYLTVMDDIFNMKLVANGVRPGFFLQARDSDNFDLLTRLAPMYLFDGKIKATLVLNSRQQREPTIDGYLITKSNVQVQEPLYHHNEPLPDTIGAYLGFWCPLSEEATNQVSFSVMYQRLNITLWSFACPLMVLDEHLIKRAKKKLQQVYQTLKLPSTLRIGKWEYHYPG
jgi:hypothetical protein